MASPSRYSAIFISGIRDEIDKHKVLKPTSFATILLVFTSVDHNDVLAKRAEQIGKLLPEMSPSRRDKFASIASSALTKFNWEGKSDLMPDFVRRLEFNERRQVADQLYTSFKSQLSSMSDEKITESSFRKAFLIAAHKGNTKAAFSSRMKPYLPTGFSLNSKYSDAVKMVQCCEDEKRLDATIAVLSTLQSVGYAKGEYEHHSMIKSDVKKSIIALETRLRGLDKGFKSKAVQSASLKKDDLLEYKAELTAQISRLEKASSPNKEEDLRKEYELLSRKSRMMYHTKILPKGVNVPSIGNPSVLRTDELETGIKQMKDFVELFDDSD